MRRHLSYLIIILLFFPRSHQAAFEFVEVGARPAALGGAYCALSDDAHGPLHNPAGMSWSLDRKVSLSICRPFGLTELDIIELSILQPVSRWAWGMNARRLGGSLYREITIGLSCSHRFLDCLSAGLCLRGLQLAIFGYGSDESWSLDAGLLAVPGSRWRWGVALRNLNNGRLGRAGEEMTQTLTVGLAYRPQEHVVLSADLLGDMADVSADHFQPGEYPLEWRLGCEARPWHRLAVCLGLQNHPIRISAGLEIFAGPACLGYAWRSHQLLGPTHHVTLTWR